MNALLCDNDRAYQTGLDLPGSARDRRADFRINLVRRPGHKILFIDHVERSINDGLWIPGPDGAPGTGAGIDPGNELADRHEVRTNIRVREGRGNVSFVDGHAEFVSRVEVEVRANALPLEE
jgi:prepilin-type processing-associated H-X9-DG protein